MKNKTTFFAKVVESEKFYGMTAGAQALYFHIGMNSTRGHCNSPYRIARGMKLNAETITELEDNGLIKIVEHGVDIVFE